MFSTAKWIGLPEDFGTVCPQFKKEFFIEKTFSMAKLSITAIGVYEAKLNGKKAGNFILTPGLTSYKARLQYQTYDITDMICDKNELLVTLGSGWHKGEISKQSSDINNTPFALIAEIVIYYTDGTEECIVTDNSWDVAKSNILSSDIYGGEVYNASIHNYNYKSAVYVDLPKNNLIPQEGEYIQEQELIYPSKYIITPKGEHVIDFGQNFAGYPEFTIDAGKGDKIRLSFAEILDSDGNFYNANYRTAQACLEYTCKDGKQTFKPHFTFYGFRYMRIDEYPSMVNINHFKGIAIYSNMERLGKITTSNVKLNRLFENSLWSQRSNFIDIPTDCPQRDERMGWTGDAQIFCKTAAYNYNVYKFFSKWLADVRTEQRENGSIPNTVPNFWQLKGSSAAWGDAICIIPWQLYLMYGDKKILSDNFDAMRKWVNYITNDTLDKYLWTCPESNKALWEKHYGDWLALDAPYGSYKGLTDDDFIASAFYAYSVSLVVKAGLTLGIDIKEYEELYKNIRKAFKERFHTFTTQTECALALYFDLTENKQKTADTLAQMIKNNGNKLKTGFVGTPYLLHALSQNGYTDIAYKLLLQEEYPSWLYEVNHGATTMWEHWDGIRDDEKLWSPDMNSYNHYAYGSVIDWVYSVAAGICPDEKHPGFKKVIINPHPDKTLKWLDVNYKTSHGEIRVRWITDDCCVKYEIETPVEAEIIIGKTEHTVNKGRYIFTEIL